MAVRLPQVGDRKVEVAAGHAQQLVGFSEGGTGRFVALLGVAHEPGDVPICVASGHALVAEVLFMFAGDLGA